MKISDLGLPSETLLRFASDEDRDIFLAWLVNDAIRCVEINLVKDAIPVKGYVVFLQGDLYKRLVLLERNTRIACLDMLHVQISEFGPTTT